MSEPKKPNQQNQTNIFIEMEHKWLKHWYENGIVEKYLHKNDSSEKRFSFQDGPITANNPMGVHHAWGRTYKDLWQKFHNLLGKKQRFVNGFDCQGLWVEVEVEKELGLKTKKDIENLVPGDKIASIAKFVQLCKDRVMKFSGIQTEQTKRLGNFMDWENSYYTMSPDNNYMIWHFLKTVHEHGWMYKGHESVPWCPRCETAISQHEMLTEDYKEVVHDSIYFALPINERKNEFLLVWTTTPWTLPANIAVAVDKKIDYSQVKVEDKYYWLASDVVESLIPEGEKVKKVKGEELVGLSYKGPFDHLPNVAKVAKENPDTFHTVIPTDDTIMPISTTEGTGMVHTAVSAGTEDFRLGKKLGLPMIPVINDDASYMEGFDFLSGKNAKKHPELILDYLKEQSTDEHPWVFKIFRYKHRYPGCWRCKTELVWKVADEWYISMDKPSEITKDDKRTLRERMMDVAKKIHWMPEFGLDRELDWLKNMHDWLISKKNRYWGLALPIYECKQCETFEVLGSEKELKDRAVKGWDQFEGKTPHKPFIDEVVIKCTSCGEEVQRIDDVGNPWLDAGIVPYSTIKENNVGEPLYLKNRDEWRKWFPVDFITESFPGQFKNWFYAMIAMSTVLEDEHPFKNVLGFGTLLGEDGRPMHKSWGNSIEFNSGADEIGVDVMRWMYTRHNPADNLLFGPNKANEVRRQFYLLLWNIFKYYRDYAEVDGFKPARHAELDAASKEIPDQVRNDVNNENVLDIWLLSRLHETIIFVKEQLEQYNVRDASMKLEEFVSDFSTWYIRRSRDRVGVAAENEQDKNAFYQTMHYALINVSIVLSPILPFISEEMYTQLTGKESVHLAFWPEVSKESVNQKLISDMVVVRAIAEAGQRVRKELKLKVRQPLASIEIKLPQAMKFNEEQFIEQYNELLKAELNVKAVTYKEMKGEEIEVTYDTEITPELKLEGELRDLLRTIQQKRKELGIQVTDQITLTVPEQFKQFEDLLKKQVQAKAVQYGDLEVTL